MTAEQPNGPLLVRREPVMGTDVEFRISRTVTGTGARDAADAAVSRAMDWLRWVDRTFSTYRADSQISRLTAGMTELEECHPEVRGVLAQCDEAKRATRGAFDAYASGALDPSGFVKGWAVERASLLLDSLGFGDHAIECGGDIRLRGRPDHEGDWQVGIRHPLHRTKLCAVVRLDHGAVATSGTYERGLHVTDPRAARPAQYWISATVIGPDLTTTDVYATALLVMAADAPSWIEAQEGYESLLIDQAARPWRSSGVGDFEIVPPAQPATRTT